MKDVSVRTKKAKFSLTSKMLLAALALAAIVGLGTASHAAQEGTGNERDELFLLLYRQTSVFNPFTLSGGRSAAQSGSGPAMPDVGPDDDIPYRWPIRLPFKPALRSPCRPPFVP